MQSNNNKIKNIKNSSGVKKCSAFTLAELMIIMSVLTVVLAAVAPIFTSRFTNVSFDNVWSNVGASNMNDIYSDAPIRSMMQQVMIGITPIDMEDIRRTYRPYSKLILRSSHKIGGNKIQKQIEFRVNGTTTGYLFAANANNLIGGEYNNINFGYNPPSTLDTTQLFVDTGTDSDKKAYGNTAMGTKALNSITKGQNNTALGYYALSNLTTGSENTAFGYSAGSSITTGSGNTLIGYNSYNAATGDYNTVIGNNSSSRSTASNYTTAVGNNINVKGDYNTAIGDSSNAGGSYNTAIGFGALKSSDPDNDTYGNFQYNTAIGYKSCSGISKNAKYTTCVGGEGINTSIMSSTAQGLINDSDAKNKRVFIGKPTSKYSSAATLEVHSLTTNNSYYPYPGASSSSLNLGDSSVIVNGNLIVRGQTYMNGRSPYPITPGAASNYSANTISLMGYRLYKESKLTHKPLIGMDGSEHLIKMIEPNGNKHETITGREHCICTYSCTTGSNDSTGRISYDWSSRLNSNYKVIITNSQGNHEDYYYNPHGCGASYNASSHNADNYELNRAHVTTNAGFNNINYPDSAVNKSCCPMLMPSGNQIRKSVSSDIRLKNINFPFNDGIFMLSKLNVYNYTFKADKNKTPNVGVIAQDLKLVFPNSVTKDDNGYYKIRTDEIFYSAINAVKELNKNIVELTSRINDYIRRISKLKKENNELKNQLIILSKQIDELEK